MIDEHKQTTRMAQVFDSGRRSGDLPLQIAWRLHLRILPVTGATPTGLVLPPILALSRPAHGVKRSARTERNFLILCSVQPRGHGAAGATGSGAGTLPESRTAGTGYHGWMRSLRAVLPRPATPRESTLRQGHAPAADRFSRARPMYRSHDQECPRCGGPAHRIQRRKIDRLISLLFPRRRFRCGSIGCGWEGNLPVRPSPAPIAKKR